MEELYVEGVATRDDPEPCVGVREGTGEASGWARAGRAIEPRNNHSGVPTLSQRWKATLLRRFREPLADPARSENQGMRGAFMRENREIP